MFKIDSPGATGGNEFTEGNPGLGVPATEVSDEWLNAVQRELVEIVEFAGITLSKLDDTQVRKAIQGLISTGGNQQIKQAIANNTAAVDITGLIFDKADFQAVRMDVAIDRNTASQNEQEFGTLFLIHDPTDDVWRLFFQSLGDDAGVTFTVLPATGQIQAASDDLTGGSHAGNLRVNNIVKFKQ